MTQPTRAIIADDERELRTYLKGQLSQVWPELIICGEAGNGPEALALIKEHRPDIAFLDIRMPGLSGMEVAKRCGGKCRVVFITAYDHYAVEAFENEAIDYILKPVTPDRLEKTVERLKNRVENALPPPSDLSKVLDRLLLGLKEGKKPDVLRYIRAQHGNSIQLIPVDEICYFKASDKYTAVVTRSGESLIKKPIKELVDELDAGKFWRIHRGTIVNVGAIDKVKRSLTGRLSLKLKGLSEILTVSRTYTHLFRQM